MKSIRFLLTVLAVWPGLLDAGTFAFGLNGDGQLGDGTLFTRQRAVSVIASGALAGRTVTAIAAGSNHSLALTSDGRLFAWGLNDYGQLGNGTNTSQSAPGPVDMTGVLAGKTIVAICAGSYHNYAVDSAGRVYAWGNNTYGQLGDGTLTNRRLPVEVNMNGALAGESVTAVSSGSNHTIALTDSGRLFAWGRNAEGALGDGTLTDRPLPVAVLMNGALAGRRVTAISTGRVHSLALTAEGLAFSWGLNDNGQLGIGSTTRSTAPAAVSTAGALAGKRLIALDGGFFHTLAISADGGVFTWGHNTYGQLGDGTTTQRLVPVAINIVNSGIGINTITGRTPVAVSGGRFHSMLLTADGLVFTWGRNNDSQLGNGSTLQATSPGGGAGNMSDLAGKIAVSIVAGGEFCLVNTLGPEVAVTQGGLAVEDEAAPFSFGTLAPGESALRTFIIRNTGPETLLTSGATVTSSAFTVVSQPAASIPPGATSFFDVRCTPATGGPHSGTLRLLTNDADEAVWTMALTARRHTSLDLWRFATFGTFENSGQAADDADPDADGLDNRVEHAFALSPLTPGTTGLPTWLPEAGGLSLAFTPPADAADITYHAEYSTSLMQGNWLPIPNTGLPPAHRYQAPATEATRLFLRLRVTSP